jgi:hypothetical protein
MKAYRPVACSLVTLVLVAFAGCKSSLNDSAGAGGNGAGGISGSWGASPARAG